MERDNCRQVFSQYVETKRNAFLATELEGTIDLYLSNCGMGKCCSGQKMGPEIKDEYVVFYIVSGKGIYKVRDKQYHLSENDYFLVCANEEVSCRADENDPWSIVWVGFKGEKVRSFIEYAGLNKTENLVGRCENKESILEYIKKILSVRGNSSVDEMKKIGYLYLIFAKLLEERELESENGIEYSYTSRKYIQYVIEYVEKNYRQQIRVNDIADSIGLNRSYMTTLFKKIMGESPKEYLVRFRMEKAEILLRKTNIRIQLVAEQVGYNEMISFSRAFKKKNNVSPSEYRKNAQSFGENT